MIVTANVFFNTSWKAYKLAVINLGMMRAGLPLPLVVDDSRPVEAYINRGRWLAKCECGGCEKIWDDGQFMCQSCWNAGSKHQFRPVIMPDEIERVEIEALLECRPLENRNWKPGETIQQLEAENEEHRAELLEGVS